MLPLRHGVDLLRLRHEDDVDEEVYEDEDPDDGVWSSSRSSGRGTPSFAPGEANNNPFLDRHRRSTRARGDGGTGGISSVQSVRQITAEAVGVRSVACGISQQ